MNDIKFDEPDSVDYQQARDDSFYKRELARCFLGLFGKQAADKVIYDFRKKELEMKK